MSHQFLMALGYGGDRTAAAWFEWNFRCLIGVEDKADFAGRDKFIQDFVAATENGQEYAIPVDDPTAPMVRQFAEFAKSALADRDDLFAFYILEDVETPNVQYKLYLKKDAPGEELPEHQMYVDGFDVPRDALVWMQQNVGCRFYITEDRTEMMIEFPNNGPEELPVLM
ncbi:MAG TPA: hypothetical protein VFV52_16115 [Bacilli bacterium]|nr:hypothetical protein [Bacilli bacterium]